MLLWLGVALALTTTGLVMWNWLLRRFAITSSEWIIDELLPYLEIDAQWLYEANHIRITALPELEYVETYCTKHIIPATIIWVVTIMLVAVLSAGTIEPFISVVGITGVAYMIMVGLYQHAYYVRICMHLHSAQMLLDQKNHYDDELEQTMRECDE